MASGTVQKPYVELYSQTKQFTGLELDGSSNCYLTENLAGLLGIQDAGQIKSIIPVQDSGFSGNPWQLFITTANKAYIKSKATSSNASVTVRFLYQAN